MLVKLPKPFSAGTSANEVSKASLVPLLRFGPRQLAGVDGLYHLKQLGAVAGKAAAVTTTEARTVQSSAQLPRATRPYMRPMRAAYMPTSVLLRKPAARKPHRKGVDWQLRVLTDAAQCFEDVAAADRVDVAEKYRANPPQPQPPQQPQRPSHDPLVAQMLRVRNLRATLAEAEDMVGRASSTLAPLLCTLACALLQATPLDATDEAEAIAEAEALGARAATCAGADLMSRADEAEALGKLMLLCDGMHWVPTKSAEAVLAANRLSDEPRLRCIQCMGGLRELSYCLESRGEHRAAVRMLRCRYAAGRAVLKPVALRTAASAIDWACALLRSSARPEASWDGSGGGDGGGGAGGEALQPGMRSNRLPSPPRLAADGADAAAALIQQRLQRKAAARAEGTKELLQQQIQSAAFVAIDTAHSELAEAAHGGDDDVAAARVSTRTCSDGELRSGLMAQRDPSQVVAARSQSPDSAAEYGWDSASDAVALLQGRLGRRLGLLGAIGRWRDHAAAVRERSEWEERRRKRAAALNEARVKMCAEALEVLADVEQRLNAFDEARSHAASQAAPVSAAIGAAAAAAQSDMPAPPPPAGMGALAAAAPPPTQPSDRSDASEQDGSHTSFALRASLVACRADVLEHAGSLEAAIHSLQELSRMQSLSGTSPRSRVVPLAKLADLVRRTAGPGQADWPLRHLLLAERELGRHVAAPSGVDDRGDESRRAAVTNEGKAGTGSQKSSAPQLVSVARMTSEELLETYAKSGRVDEALRLILSEASPVPKREQMALEGVVSHLQASFRARRYSATIIAAAERARVCRRDARVRRQRRDAALVLQTFFFARSSRWHAAILAEKRTLNRAATVFQNTQRSRVDAGRPQWPWRLATTAATIHARTSKKKASEVDQEATSSQSSPIQKPPKA